MFSPDKPFKVYEQNYWWSDSWNPLDYGRDFDFNKSFFEQFQGLIIEIPRLWLYINDSCENCDYTNQIYDCNDCYLTFSCQNTKNCLYWKRLIDCVNCIDCLLCVESENIYSSVDILKSNNCFYSLVLYNCRDIYFSYNCEWCNECFLCNNLKNKSYYILNKEYQKEEYYKKKKELTLLWYKKLIELLNNLIKSSINKPLNIISTENVIWDYTKNSKNCFYVSDWSDLESVKFWQFIKNIRNCYDIDYCCCESDLSYEISTWWVNMYRSSFSIDIWPNAKQVFYSDSCSSSSNLFWCIWLRNRSYCILNKQYTKEEYEELVPRIIKHMMKTGEWGEFFPSSISPFGYNETIAQEYFPLTRFDVILSETKYPLNSDNSQSQGSRDSSLRSEWQNEKSSLSWEGHQKDKESTFLHWPIFNWSDYEAPFPRVEKIIPASKLPDDISKIPDDILNWAIECEVTKKPFRIIKQELEFYRKHNLPIPRRHPDQRHLDRMKMRNPRKLWERNCDKCQKNIQTTYAPDKPERVYCETCYNAEVY